MAKEVWGEKEGDKVEETWMMGAEERRAVWWKVSTQMMINEV